MDFCRSWCVSFVEPPNNEQNSSSSSEFIILSIQYWAFGVFNFTGKADDSEYSDSV